MSRGSNLSARWVETLVGAAVLLIAGLFLWRLFLTSDLSGSTQQIAVYALMNDADGLVPGTDVRLSGVKIGRVTATRLDPETLQARVDIALDATAPVPVDSGLRVLMSGLLGGNYLSVEPGGDQASMQNGDQFAFTSDAVNLVDLIGQVLLGGGGSQGNEQKQDDQEAPLAFDPALVPPPSAPAGEGGALPILPPLNP